ncbi:zinc-binding dehydrogenase, partial [Streptomyces jumonjinensis]
YLPRGVRLSAYGGGSADLPPDVFQHYLDRIATGQFSTGPIHVYTLDQIRDAHHDMEHGNHTGKLVVRL